MGNRQKIILAYSGGLVNTVAIHWLRTHRRMRVVTFSADLGQGGEDLEELAELALTTGAEAAHSADLRDRLLAEFAFPALKANAVYEGGYMLSTALSRPLIAQELVRLAREEGCEFIGHGALGSSNDMIRFESAVNVLAPDLNILAPRREWKLDSVEQIFEYAQRYGITAGRTGLPEPYTRDQNIWGCRTSGGTLEDPAHSPSADVFRITTAPETAPDLPALISLEFESGTPVGLDGQRLDSVELIEKLNTIGGQHGVGRVDHVENRMFGTKVREVYEAPGAAICYAAHTALQKLTLGARALHVIPAMSSQFAALIYEGMWFSDLREGFCAFFDHIERPVTGFVRVKLYKGTITVMGAESPFSLYQREFSTIARTEPRDVQAVAGWLRLARSLDRHTSKVRRSHTP